MMIYRLQPTNSNDTRHKLNCSSSAVSRQRNESSDLTIAIGCSTGFPGANPLEHAIQTLTETVRLGTVLAVDAGLEARDRAIYGVKPGRHKCREPCGRTRYDSF